MSCEPGSDVAVAMHSAVRARLLKRPERPLVLGLCGCPGSGKSTAALALERRLAHAGVRAATLSLDDLYLSRADRARLAASVHPLAASRGPPGTHDIDYGLKILDALATRGPVTLPRFNKARDDRYEETSWRVISAPVEVVILEGWCVGAAPQSASALISPVNDLERDQDSEGYWRKWANERLAGPYQRLFKRIDLLVLLAAPSFDVVLRWRGEQEAALRQQLEAAGGDASGCMDEAALARFLAPYERLTKHILAEMPARADLVISLDSQRLPLAALPSRNHEMS